MRRTLSVSLLLLALQVQASDWQHFNADAGGSKFSALTQITPNNVEDLEEAWRFSSGDLQKRSSKLLSRSAGQATPILLPEEAGGHLAYCTPFNEVIALDPGTGKVRWRYDAQTNPETKWAFKCRGVTLWRNDNIAAGQTCDWTLFQGTLDRRMIALDARTGAPCTHFGDNGAAYLYDRKDGQPEHTFSASPPVINNGVLVTGSSMTDFTQATMAIGEVVALDAHSGAVRWRFNPIPLDPNDPAASTWPPNPAKISGAANAWAPLSSDEALGLVYVPTSSPSPDYWGVLRPGDNRYANSLVALEADTGRVRWHFQFVHHDLWDYDVPSQPQLVNIERKGKTVPAVIQVTKQGWVFAFDRRNGESLFEIIEQPVPQPYLANEQASPTQPFPTAPPALIDQHLKPEDAWGFTFWDEGACEERIRNARSDGIYTPIGEDWTVVKPSTLGGGNWGGGAFWEARNTLYLNLNTAAMIARLADIDEARGRGNHAPRQGQVMVTPMEGTPYAIEMGVLDSPLGVPCIAPPWGKLVALDMSKGEVLWESALGSIHEMGPVPVPFEINWGTPNLGGPMATASGLIFIGATMDRRIRAYDADSGGTLWSYALPVDAAATPMTYKYKGKQYVVINAAGHMMFGREIGDYLVAFALPD